MRRWPLLLLLVVLLAATAFAPGRAAAASPCRNKIFNDWYRDGKIASTYPISCYRDALKHIPPDVRVYTGLADDIRFALQAAIDRSHGKAEPAQVSSHLTSSGGPTSDDPPTSSTKHHSPTSTAPTSPDAGGGATTTTKTPTGPIVAPAAGSSSSGVPVPVLVLGGVALLLVASGGIGLGVKHFRR
ncbi:MAG TPA: hypothetical protein VH538_03350 [Gaiellaceae bacterium]|jgi:hypothetical protein